MSTASVEKKVKKTSSKPKKVDVEQAQPTPAVEIIKEAPVEAPAKKKRAKKEVADVAPEASPAQAPEAQAEQSQSEGSNPDEKLSRKKRSYVQLVSEVDQLNELVDHYVLDHRDPKNTDLNRFLKGLEKGLRKVRVHVQKMGKTRGASSQSSGSAQSGFQKPVRISEAVAQFTGWSSEEPRARVEVTNFVCDYIKQNNLQSPTDRRVILADQRLSQLLEYNAERDGDLTYATIQKLLAKHYTSLAQASA
jgi:chromatin remodeling complex protein RSC6